MMIDIIFQTLAKGGLILIVIILITLFAWYLLLEKINKMKRFTGEKGNLALKTRKLIRTKGVSSAVFELEKMDTPFSRMLVRFLSQAKSKRDIEFIYSQTLSELEPQWHENIGLIGILASICPLLGLLGTVSGMMSTFDVIHFFGAANPMLMADGISEALITTQAGLLASIPLLLFLALIKSRVRTIENDFEKGYLDFVNDLNWRELNAGTA